MKTIFSVVIATAIGSLASLVASGVTFQERTRNMSPDEKAAYAERIKAHRLRKTGGSITDTRSMKGSVVFLNAQSRIPLSAFSDIPDRLAKLLRRKITFSTSDKTVAFAQIGDAVAKTGGTCVIVITDDADMPTLLLAPESKWAVVNVRQIADKDEQLSATRLRREALRAFGFLCGADAPSEGSVLNAVTKVEDIDNLVGESFGQDVIMVIEKHLDSIGVTAYSDTTYRKACQEGWAPPPTNDVQKAIWEETHAIPKTPMKIEFDPKKGR